MKKEYIGKNKEIDLVVQKHPKIKRTKKLINIKDWVAYGINTTKV